MSLASGQRYESDDFGWDVWRGRVSATWDLRDSGSTTDEILALIPDLLEAERYTVDDDELSADIGGMELMALLLDVPHPVFGGEALVASDGWSIFEAADALSQDLADLVGPLTEGAELHPFTSQVMEASETGWFDSLLLVRSVGIAKPFRGHGIGAWSTARAIAALAPNPTTLVALKAAPLSRTEFLRDLGNVDDPDKHHEFTDAQSRAWDDATQRIAENWQRSLGLRPLAKHPSVLFSPGGMNDVLVRTTAGWKAD